MMLQGKKILLGITGSIAAYKSAILVRLLTKAGAEVKVVMTPSATTFISPLTLSTLSRNNVVVQLSESDTWANHVMLGRWADVMLIAPLSCNTLAKSAHGICDNLLMAVLLSATCPVIVAPAMDEDMWKHSATQTNLETIKRFGYKVMSVVSGELASGLIGPGRMSEPEDIVKYVEKFFEVQSDFKGKKVMVTAGGTCESIDPVRYISNHSSGKMGFALAEEFHARGAEVFLVYGKVSVPIPKVSKTISILTAEEMYHHSVALFPEMDMAIMCAAVADYTPEIQSDVKIKKQADRMQVNLVKTKDILHTLGKQKKTNQFLVGFALETNDELVHAREKLVRKNADMIVMNSMNDAGAGFGTDTNKVTILFKDGNQIETDVISKKEAASKIVDAIKSFSGD